MDFRQIQYFLELAETLNFTRAANNCHVTQPTLTQAIKRLEEELGGQLLIRDGRNTRLSKLGQMLQDQFLQLECARRDLKEQAQVITSGGRTTLRLGVCNSVGPGQLIEFVQAFRRRQGKTKLTLHSIAGHQSEDKLLSGEIDACFTLRPERNDPKLDFDPLFEEELVVVFPKGHPFEGKDLISLAEIAKESLIATANCDFLRKLQDQHGAIDPVPEVALISERSDWIQSMVLSGAGVSILPVHAVTLDGILHRPIDSPVARREVALASVYGGPKSSALREFITIARGFNWGSPRGKELTDIVRLAPKHKANLSASNELVFASQ